MVIISILLGFILNAAMESVKRAQERATQTLITKLEGGLNDRLDALLQTRPDPNTAHLALAAVYNSLSFPNQSLPNNGRLEGYLRAQVIAWYDYIKREMPDTFFVQNDANYPINFTGQPYPISVGTPIPTVQSNLAPYILPMGNSILPPYGDGNLLNPAGLGVYGASYPIAAGIYKNLGYVQKGYDGIDDNGNGLIDEYAEGAPNATVQATVQAHLANHKHVTARAEMLYAILVEGQGPLGSVFNRDEFTDKEVQDTDGDGLPEFVDAWGNPLQFFRWPLLYHSDLQRGQVIQSEGGQTWTLLPPYAGPIEQREQDPLDLNQQLVAPAWWSGSYNDSAGNFLGNYPGQATKLGASTSVQAFEYYFHRLTEPFPTTSSGPLFWDRAGTYGARRAFYSKFLIVSGGLDEQLGVFLYSDAALNGLGSANAAWALIANENNAMPFSAVDANFDLTGTATYGSTAISYSESYDPTTPSSSDLLSAAQDDISNQNIQSTVGIGGSGS